MTGPTSLDRTLWVMTDGRAGNESQANGLATALSRISSAQICVLRPDLRASLQILPASAQWALWRLIPGRIAQRLITATDLPTAKPSLIIGAGRRIAPLVALTRARYGVPAVQILSPQMPRTAFDAVIVPSHDQIRGPNVLTSIGALSARTVADISRAACPEVPAGRPILAVLIGGPSGSARFTQTDEESLLQALTALGKTWHLVVTPSRRTPDTVRRALKRLAQDGHTVWAGQDPNPYPGLLTVSDAVLVTADSVNMASEAAATGKPVHIFPIHRLAPKLARFHKDLEAHGASRPLSLPLATWSYTPLAEPDRIARCLVDRGLW